jgi:hypothetical protein
MAPPKRSKYGAVKTVVDGITFASKREAARFVELKLLERSGEIRDLRLQPSFEIIPAIELDGKKQRPVRYLADFCYMNEDGRTVYEDVKGFRTEVYRIKRRLVKHVFGVEILEVR